MMGGLNDDSDASLPLIRPPDLHSMQMGNAATAAPPSSESRMVVYCAISGGYDVLVDPTFREEGVDYVAFCDDAAWWQRRVRVWNCRPFPTSGLDPVRRARQLKLLTHTLFPDHEYSVWVDGNIDILDSPRGVLDHYGSPDFLCFKHPWRACAYQEAEACIEERKDSPEAIRRQMDRYHREGFPAGSGLIESNVLIRRHNHPQVIALAEAWWAELLSETRRDQLSFNYVAWKQGFRYHTMGDTHARGSSPAFSMRNRSHRARRLSFPQKVSLRAFQVASRLQDLVTRRLRQSGT